MTDLDALEALAKAAISRGQEDCESLHDWFSAEEFISNALLHPVDARFAEASTPRALLSLIAEVRALREDEERLSWFFSFDPPKNLDFANAYLRGLEERWNLDQWRAAIDAARKETT